MQRLMSYAAVPGVQLMLDMSQSFTGPSLLPLVVENLSYRIDGKQLLDNINTRVEASGISVVLGPNGAGKSLLVRLLHGLLESESGMISWNGKAPDLATRKRQALVLQKPVLLRRSVAANIDFVLKSKTGELRQQCDAILRDAGLLEQREQPARLLSGGEQQRLALARALATNPQVLLLDEPTASLDAATTFQIETLLEKARASGIKIFLVTHDIAQARRLADDVMFMHAGKLLEHSSGAVFFSQPSSRQAQAYLEGRLLF